MTAEGVLPFGQQPVLRVGGPDGALLGQSTALCRFVARLADPSLELYPTDPITAAVVDGILMQDDDMRAGFYCMNYPARYGFEEALDVSNSDPSKLAPQPSEVRKALHFQFKTWAKTCQSPVFLLNLD